VISGKRRANLAALHPATGAVKDWSPNPRVDNDYQVFDLAVTNKAVYVAGGGRNPDGTAEAFGAGKGASVWRYSSSGDFQAVALLKGKLYFGGHFTKLYRKTDKISRNRLMAVAAPTGRLDARWKPSAKNGGVWSMTADPARHRVYAGGSFTQINGRPQRGFASLSVRWGGTPPQAASGLTWLPSWRCVGRYHKGHRLPSRPGLLAAPALLIAPIHRCAWRDCPNQPS
jgi:hypothetical protein